MTDEMVSWIVGLAAAVTVLGVLVGSLVVDKEKRPGGGDGEGG